MVVYTTVGQWTNGGQCKVQGPKLIVKVVNTDFTITMIIIMR